MVLWQREKIRNLLELEVEKMSRDNYNYGAGKMGDNRTANQQVKDVAREFDIDEKEFSDYVHAVKEDFYTGDFKYSVLRELARDYKRG